MYVLKLVPAKSNSGVNFSGIALVVLDVHVNFIFQRRVVLRQNGTQESGKESEKFHGDGRSNEGLDGFWKCCQISKARAQKPTPGGGGPLEN